MRNLPRPPAGGRAPQRSRELMSDGDASLFKRMRVDDMRASGRYDAARRLREFKSTDIMQGLASTSDELVRNVDRHNKILREILKTLREQSTSGSGLSGGREPRGGSQRGNRQRVARRPRQQPRAPRRDGSRTSREPFANRSRRQPTARVDAHPRSRPSVLGPSTRPRIVRPGIAGALMGGAMAGLADEDAVGGAVVGGGVAAGVSIAAHLADQRIRQQLTRHVSGRISERVLTKIPVAGLLVSLFFAGQRAYAGDWVGAGLEVAAGTAGALGPLTFGIGTGVALGIDAASLARDAYSVVYGVNIEDDPQRTERLRALTVAVGEVIAEMMANRPRPTAPPINVETRDRLMQLYRSVGDNEDMINFIGPDVLASLRGLLSVDIDGEGVQQRRARESMESVLGALRRRMSSAGSPQRLASPGADQLLTPASNRIGVGEEKEDAIQISRVSALGSEDDGVDDSDARTSSSGLPYPENLIDMMSKTEFNEISIEAEDITFDGEIEVARDSMQLRDAARYTPTETPDLDTNLVTRTSVASAALDQVATAVTAPEAPAAPTTGAAAAPETTQVSAAPVTPAMASATVAGGTGEQITQIVQVGAGFTTVQYADGSVERRTGTRNWRNNNPGNIEFGDFARRYGAIGSDGRFAVFPTYEAGRAAKEALLFEGRSYRSLTIEQAMMRYAPPSENNTASYINSIVQAVGVPASTPLQTLTPEQRRAMLSVMERIEGFRVGRVDVLQRGRLREDVAQVPAAPSTGGALTSSGTELAVDDQTRMRAAAGSTTIIVPPVQADPPSQPVQPARLTSAEVPLNRRLELQVA